MHVLGRDAADTDAHPAARPTARLGRYRAADGSHGAAVGLDLDRPHAALVVGKRGYGKSYTLGVLAEAAARAAGVAPVVVDPMGVFEGLTAPAGGGGAGAAEPVPARVVTPTVAPDAVPPPAWPTLLGLDPDSPAGSLCRTVAGEATGESLAAWAARVAAADATRSARRTVRNGLRLADSWGVFDPAGLDADALLGGEATVLDCSGLCDAALGAVVRAVAHGLYRRCVEREPPRLPWLLVDEAHVVFDGVAAPALRTLLTRGRAPGVSLVAATQRPSALPDVAHAQSDLLVAHRLTAGADVAALEAASPTYLRGTVADRLPTEPGAALVVDDTTESVHGVAVRTRATPHGGDSPLASDRAVGSGRREGRSRRVETTE
jgi:hypothetical protein